MIDDLIKKATLSKDKVSLNAYKNLKTELQKVLTAKNAPEYSDALFTQISAKYAKSLEDAVLQFSEAGRDDLVSEYREELEVVKKLLPEPVNERDIYDELLDWADSEGYVNRDIACEVEIPKRDMGLVIKHLKKVFPTADGKLIANIVKENLI